MKSDKPDYILLTVISILIFYGLIMVASGGIVISLQNFANPYYFFKKQLISLLVGIFLAYVAYKIPYRKWRVLSLPLFIINLILLALVLVPHLGFGPGDTKRWLDVGPISFQPSEFLKLSLIIYLAAIWSNKSRDTEIARYENEFLPFIAIMIIIAGLMVAEPDIGTLTILSTVAILMFFLSGARMRYIFLIITIAIGAFIVLLKTAAYRANRWTVFLHPELDIKGIGYQINQALLAMGAGGIFGAGLGQSKQKYNFLPEPITDSIAAIIGEELGYIGLVVLIGLFLLIIWRALYIYKKTSDNFAKLLVGGIIILITSQSIIHFSAISGLMPLTGVPLPFISYGGSSLTVNLIAIGILLNISKQQI